MGSLQDMDCVDADAPHHQVERAGRPTQPHRGVHRRRVPRRAGERPGAGVPRDAARSPHEHGGRRRPSPPAPLPSRPRARRGDPGAIAEAARAPGAAQSARCSSSARSSAGRPRETRSPFAERIGAPFYLNGMARGATPSRASPLMTRSRRFALAQADVASCFGTPFDFRVDYGRTRHVERRREGRADRSRRRRARQEPAGRRRDPRRQRARARAAPRRGRRSEADPSELARRGARRRGQAPRARCSGRSSRTTSPPNPLRVCAELGKRLGPNDIVIGDGGDFVATAAYVLKLEWPQLWMDPGPARHARRRPRLRDGGQARAARCATWCSSTATASSASTRSSSRRWCARTSRSSRVIGNDAALDADPPRPGRDLRRPSARWRRRSTTRATTKVVRGAAAASAPGSSRSRSSGRRSTRPSRAASRRAST